MKKIGITGESGFIGTVLRETLRLTDAVHIPFQREFFGDRNAMCGFVSQCDAVVHLAAVSRSQDPQAMYETNMRLTACLADAAEQSRNKPHIYFGSTTHEAKDTLYHDSKRDGRRLLETSGAKYGYAVTTLFMPNCFGAYGRPFWNSFVSTLCFLCAAGKEPERISDDTVELIHVGELCRRICRAILSGSPESAVVIPASASVKVSDIYAQLRSFDAELAAGRVPHPDSKFGMELLQAYWSYLMPHRLENLQR